MNNKIGYIKYYDEIYNIKVTQQLIYKARIQVMNEVTFTKETTKRKRTTTIDEEEIIQNNPNKRINNGQEFEKAVYKEMNNAGFKQIKTQTMNLYDKKPRVEISGNDIEITHEMINNNTKTTVQKAQKVIIFN